MPRGTRKRSNYAVFLSRYVSLEVKRQIETRSITGSLVGCYESKMFYWGYEERTAALWFYRACQEMAVDPLAISVMMRRDSAIVVQVKADK